MAEVIKGHHFPTRWRKIPAPIIRASRPLDSWKIQAPGIVSLPGGGFRLFYTAVGPGKPFPSCQGYILSAVSEDGLTFQKEEGIRIAPDPKIPHSSLRVIAPSVTPLPEGGWRMYFESRGPADKPTVICSAVSKDLINWSREEGIRFSSPGGVGGGRYLDLGGGRGRLYCFSAEYGPGGRTEGKQLSQGIISAVTDDGLTFQPEPGYRVLGGTNRETSAGITAGEVFPLMRGSGFGMVYSAWQDVPPATEVPPHPSSNKDAAETGGSGNFAAASIAADMAGYRSRIFLSLSSDGLEWGPAVCIIQGGGYGSPEIDAVHAEDMAVLKFQGEGKETRYRIYYAACDANGVWQIAGAEEMIRNRFSGGTGTRPLEPA